MSQLTIYKATKFKRKMYSFSVLCFYHVLCKIIGISGQIFFLIRFVLVLDTCHSWLKNLVNYYATKKKSRFNCIIPLVHNFRINPIKTVYLFILLSIDTKDKGKSVIFFVSFVICLMLTFYCDATKIFFITCALQVRGGGVWCVWYKLSFSYIQPEPE